MSTPIKITLLTNYDDWEALYINGTKVAEGHKIRLSELAEALGYELETREQKGEIFPKEIKA